MSDIQNSESKVIERIRVTRSASIIGWLQSCFLSVPLVVVVFSPLPLQGQAVCAGLTMLFLIVAAVVTHYQFPRTVSLENGSLTITIASSEEIYDLSRIVWYRGSTLADRHALFIPYRKAVVLAVVADPDTSRFAMRAFPVGLNDECYQRWTDTLRILNVRERSVSVLRH